MNEMESITVEVDVDDAGLISELIATVIAQYPSASYCLCFQSLVRLNESIQFALNDLSGEPDYNPDHF
jgi:hypothetical protein